MIARPLVAASVAIALSLLGAPVQAGPLVDLATLTFAKAPLPDARPTDADPAIWVVRDPDTTIYLFGTIHILKPGLTWFDDAVKAAFDRSDELVIEMIEPDAATIQRTTVRLGLDTSGTSLRERLTPEARGRYEAALATLSLPPAAFDSFRPWLAAVSLSVLPLLKAGFDPKAGVERTILSGNMKPVSGLETLDEQFGFFADLADVDQIAFLNATVDSVGASEEDSGRLVDAWAAGDVDRVAAVMNEGIADSPPVVASVLLSDRNARWAKWIEDRLRRPGTVFLAVGAGHLAGDESVQAKLATDGIQAVRIVY